MTQDPKDWPSHEDDEAMPSEIGIQQPNSWHITTATEFDLPPAVPWVLNWMDKLLLQKMGIKAD